ncbi:MAG: hypothetical protein R2911_03030 [Caldilineaceae bacterium]
MQTVPQIVPISEMANNQSNVMPLLANVPRSPGPAQQNRPGGFGIGGAVGRQVARQELEQRELDRQRQGHARAGDFVDYADIAAEMDALDHAHSS